MHQKKKIQIHTENNKTSPKELTVLIGFQNQPRRVDVKVIFLFSHNHTHCQSSVFLISSQCTCQQSGEIPEELMLKFLTWVINEDWDFRIWRFFWKELIGSNHFLPGCPLAHKSHSVSSLKKTSIVLWGPLVMVGIGWQ